MKKRTKWLLAILIVVVVVALGTGVFFFYNFDAYFMAEQEITTGMDPEETMAYYYDAWDKGDFKTMEKMWLEIPPQMDSLRKLRRCLGGQCRTDLGR